MRISHDPESDSLYIHISEGPSVDSEEVLPGMVLDFSATGAVVGIEILNAGQKFDLDSVEGILSAAKPHAAAK